MAGWQLVVHIFEKLENQEKGLDGLDISLENSISGTLKSFSGFAYKNCSERLEKNKKVCICVFDHGRKVSCLISLTR